jgi:hypothetical protein
MKEERKKNRYWLLPVDRTGVPGGGRAGSENVPHPVKWKYRALNERRSRK